MGREIRGNMLCSITSYKRNTIKIKKQSREAIENKNKETGQRSNVESIVSIICS